MDNAIAGGMAGLGIIYVFFIIAAAVLAFFVPFFIFRIRNETIKTNKKLDQIIDLLSRQHTPNKITEGQGELDTNKGFVPCPSCNLKNRATDPHCYQCGYTLT
ncbi:MAG: Ran-binding zinc finger domain-containing protein [Pseudomonadota bacterium]